ncbi:MAG: OBAP family protein [Myxococcota bacterium]
MRCFPRLSPRRAAGLALCLVSAGCASVGKSGGGPLPADATEKASAQALTPVEQINTWLDAFHVDKMDPSHVMEVQHYCDILNQDVIQCALYDQSTKRARLVGVEYIIPEGAFAGLPNAEKPYWHPHNYEVLSGALVAPGMPAAQEQALMAQLLNTYGKTWHTWDAASAPLPLGDPRLAWSFNADRELAEALVTARDERLGIDSDAVRERRAPLIQQARPQVGVDALRDAFPDRRAFPGVWEEGEIAPPRPGTR